MSDLLSRLVSRAAGTASRVEPILPSRYDPAGVRELPVQSEPDHPASLAPPTGMQKPVFPDTESGRQPQNPDQEPHGWRPRETQLQVHEQILPDLVETLQTSSVPLAPAPAPSPASVDHLQVSGAPAAAADNSLPEIRVERSYIRAAMEAPVEHDAPTIPLAYLAQAARGQSGVAEARTARPQDRVPAEPVQPVEVQVTIGHIEVRTAPANAPVPQRRAPKPGVSLDDYLRRRNGGGR